MQEAAGLDPSKCAHGSPCQGVLPRSGVKAQSVVGVLGGEVVWPNKPGLLAPQPFHFLRNSSRTISICMHASISAFVEVSLLPLLQGLGPMEKRKMWLGGNSNEFLQIAFV